MPSFVCKNCGFINDKPEIVPVESATFKNIYSITCSLCLNETHFWRDKPFPVDK